MKVEFCFDEKQVEDIKKRLLEIVAPVAEKASRIDAQHAKIMKRIEALEANVAFRP